MSCIHHMHHQMYHWRASDRERRTVYSRHLHLQLDIEFVNLQFLTAVCVDVHLVIRGAAQSYLPHCIDTMT